MSRFLRKIALVGGLAVALAAGVLTPGAAEAQVLLPSDAMLNSVSCPVAGSCAAVGSYSIVAGEPLGLLMTQTDGVWKNSIKAVLPGTASTYPNANIVSVSCASAGNCAAVGDYTDANFNQQGVVINERNGNWRNGTRIGLPANASGSPQVTMSAVSCHTAGNCTAVGSYVDSIGETVALSITETNWVWGRGEAVPLPGGASATGSSALSAVSCTGAGSCTAVGWYADSSGAIQGMMLTQTAGSWGPGVEAYLPTPGNSQPDVTLSAVACSSPGTCAAIGQYNDASNNQLGLLLSENRGLWSIGQSVVLPANAFPTQATSLNAVSCTGPGYCTAVGQYTDMNETFQGLVLTETGGVWQPGLEATLPADAAAAQLASLNSVACFAYETCVVAGSYFNTRMTGLLLTEVAGRWKLPIDPEMPSGAAGVSYPTLNSVACAAGPYCVTAGDYTDGEGNAQGLLLDGNGLYWHRGIEAALPDALKTAIRRRKPVAHKTAQKTAHKTAQKTASKRNIRLQQAKHKSSS